MFVGQLSAPHSAKPDYLTLRGKQQKSQHLSSPIKILFGILSPESTKCQVRKSKMYSRTVRKSEVREFRGDENGVLAYV